MNLLRNGIFFGETNKTIPLNGVTLTNANTAHAQKNIDWHYRENAYFTFILQGGLIEGTETETYNCLAGSLLFHNPKEPHYKIKPTGNTKCFHIELGNKYLEGFRFDKSDRRGIFSIENPDIKFLFYKAFTATKFLDDAASLSIEMLLFEILGQTMRFNETERKMKPFWVKKLKGILHDSYAEKLSVEALSAELKIHPFHLSRDFRKHFHCTFSEYLRKVRVEKALSLLPNKNLSLTEIAFECGFADQSHFLRCFKQINKTNPSSYRKLLLR